MLVVSRGTGTGTDGNNEPIDDVHSNTGAESGSLVPLRRSRAVNGGSPDHRQASSSSVPVCPGAPRKRRLHDPHTPKGLLSRARGPGGPGFSSCRKVLFKDVEAPGHSDMDSGRRQPTPWVSVIQLANQQGNHRKRAHGRESP